MTSMRKRRQGVAQRHDHRLVVYENADRAQFVHRADAKPRPYVVPLAQAKACGNRRCPGPQGFTEGYGLAGGGMGLYLYCDRCERIVAKDAEPVWDETRPPAPPADPARCHCCKRLLDRPDDPYSTDCGGDCVMCMADAGDPDCVRAVEELAAKGVGDSLSGYGFS